MAEFKTIRLEQITVPADRLRKVDDNKAFLIGRAIATNELIQPINVYRTPNGERPYTLAAGATRYRGHELHGLAEIDCLIRKLDKRAARRIEIEENLFRDDLDMLERAMHVVEYRRWWEEEHGQIKRGGDRRSDQTANLAEWSEDNAQAHFFAQALDDLGLSRRSIERAQLIGTKLSPVLRDALRQTPVADNQAMLEKLAKLEPARQQLVAKSYSADRDIGRALTLTDPAARGKATKSAQDELFERLASTWARTDQKTRDRFLQHVGAAAKKPRDRMPTNAELLEQVDEAMAAAVARKAGAA